MDRLKTNIVGPDGPVTAKILFVGEAPGAEEDSQVMPFVGSAGQLLNRCLTARGILRSDVLVHNIFCQRPPQNEIKYYFRDKSCRFPTWEGEEHIKAFTEWLTKVRDMGHLNLVVALGAIPMSVLTGQLKIEKYRGSVLPCTLVEGLKVYCTYHPSYVNRLMNEQDEKLKGDKKKKAVNVLPVFLKDLERIKEQSETKDLPRIERHFSVDLSYEELCSRLRDLNKVEVTTSVDIETLPSEDGPLLWCIGFAKSPAEAFVVPFVRGQDCAFTEEQEAELLRLISELFLGPTRKVFHNAGYDLAVLGRYYGLRVETNTHDDTMWLHHANYPTLKKSLAFCTSVYTWEPYYKDMGKVHFGVRSSDVVEFEYNCKDCCVTREIYPIVARDSRNLNTWEGYKRTRRVFESHLAMTLRGVRIDVEKKDKLKTEFEERSAKSLNEITRITGKEWNLNSWQQKQSLLYGVLGLEIQFDRSTKKPSTDKEALNRLRKRYPQNEVLGLILDYMKFSKLASTYADMIVDRDGRVHTSYRWVSTWRTSSSSSPFIFKESEKKKNELEEAGGNLQNIPRATTDEGRAVRSLFVADPGKVLIASDLSQAEDRIVTWESGNEAKIRQYLAGTVDVHWEYAKQIFEIPDNVRYLPSAIFRDKFTREDHTLKEFRNLGKTIRHATNYEVGPMQFQGELIKNGFYLESSVCKKILDSAKAKDPHLAEWKRKIRERIKADRTLVTPLGRKRTFMGRLNDNTYRAAYAFSPQSTVGELLQLAIQDIYEKYSDWIEILLNVHDEVICQVDDLPETIDAAIRAVRGSMEIPIDVGGRQLVIPCEFKVGPSWGELKEVK